MSTSCSGELKKKGKLEELNFFFTKNPNLKKKFWSGGDGGRGARVSDFFFKESKSKKAKKFFFLLLGWGWGGASGEGVLVEMGGGRLE